MGKPLWLRAFNTVEGAVGPVVEEIVHGPKFAKFVVVVQRVKTGVSKVGEKQTRRVWHVVNLPAGSDVRRLRRQIGDLDHEVRGLRGDLEKSARQQVRQKESHSGSSASSTKRGPGPSTAGRGARRAESAKRDQDGVGSG